MPWLISYDFEDDYARTKVANKLLEEGLERLQWSVFAGEVNDYHFPKLKKWLEEIVAKYPAPGNSIIIINLPPTDLKGMTVIGQPKFNYDELVDPPNTLFF